MNGQLTTCAYCGGYSPGQKYCCGGCASLDLSPPAPSVRDSKFQHLDLPNIKSRFQIGTGSPSYRLHVNGLHCASCVHLLERLPEFDSSVLSARVDFSRSTLAIKVNGEFSLARLSELLESWGYTSQFLMDAEDADALSIQENKTLLKRLAVTGACAGNIMLFVIPIYSGLDGLWARAFHWVSFLLFLPVVTYSGAPFYQGAWNSLRYRVMNVDLPIAVALISGFILSTVNLLRGDGAVYFDSTAGFVFLILCARYYLKSAQQKSTALPAQALTTERYSISEGQSERELLAEDLKVGDRLILRQGQTSPVDGVLASPALVDLAIMNGEALPRRYEARMEIMAGSKLLSSRNELVVTRPYRETALWELFQNLKESELNKPPFVSLTDRLSQWLVLCISLAAIAVFLLTFKADFQEAFNRSLALIIVACPCALAFGSPLTFNLALRKAKDRGILIKNSETLEKLWKIRNVIFDKTGTLTSLNLRVLKTEPENLRPELKRILLGLERESQHPIAFSLREAWPDQIPEKVQNLKEQIGQGVSGELQGAVYELKQNSESPASKGVSTALYRNGLKICSIDLETPLDPRSQTAVAELQGMGIDCYLASGDLVARARPVGQLCGIPGERIFGSLSPTQKRDLVRSLEPVCMVGDGSNDALALKEASIGVAVKGSTFVSLHAADIYFTSEGLEPLLSLLNLAQRTRRVLYRNLSFALIYNLIGGALAITGHMDPWLAALLMPASSALIVSSTLWGFR